MRQLCCTYVDIQFWPAQDILSLYGQWFPGIDHISCTLGLCIFEDFVPVVLGLDGLVLGSDDKTLCFRFQPSCFGPLVCHLLVYIFRTYSLWLLPVHLFLFPFLLNLVLSMTLCVFFHFPSMGGCGVSGRLSSLLKISAWLATE